MTTTKPLTGMLLNSGARTESRGVEYVSKKFQRFGVKSYCVYVDSTTVKSDLLTIQQAEVVGIYTFDIHFAGREIGGRPVQLLHIDGPIPKCDGWVVASTSRASAFTLASALYNTGNQQQIVSRLYGGQQTEIEAYMDLLSGDTETIMYLNHYFDRKYRIPFPLDIRYSVCECDGTVVRSGQRIVPPGGITVFDSREMDLGEFEGYLHVEMEVENLQVRVQPFIHFWADYISDEGMCRNHQSGWSPWPPETVFNRGYLPLEDNLESIASFYNSNENEIVVKALLHYNQNGVEKKVERPLKPIAPGHLSYQNLSSLFGDISLRHVNAAYVLLTCDKPLHRPNHYIAIKGSKKMIETFHQTGGKSCHWSIPSYSYTRVELEKLRLHGVPLPWSVRLPILEERFSIHTYLGLLSMTLCDQSDCTYLILDATGKEVFSEDVTIDGTTPMFLNINEFAKKRGVDIPHGGTFCLNPKVDNERVPRASTVFLGLKHKEFRYISTSFRGSPAEVNLPFFIQATFPHSREYTHSPLTISDHFLPGIVSEEYDSIIIVEHQSLYKDYTKVASYRLDILDADGNLYTLHRKIGPLRYDVFTLSDVLEWVGIESSCSYYTLFVKCNDTKLKPFHLLYRKSDHALSFDDGSEGTLQRDPQIGGLSGDFLR